MKNEELNTLNLHLLPMVHHSICSPSETYYERNCIFQCGINVTKTFIFRQIYLYCISVQDY